MSMSMTPSEAVSGYDGVQVFSATTISRREKLGDDLSAWQRAHPTLVPVSTQVRQSSDSSFHCFSIVVFWRSVPVPG
jgi:hypothetical protein